MLLTHAYPSPSAPLNAKFIELFAKRLAKRNVEIFVIVPRIFKNSPKYEEYDNLKLLRFEFATSQKILSQHKRIFSLELFSLLLSGIISATSCFKRFKPNLVHIHFLFPMGLVGIYLKLRFKVPVIISCHGTDIILLPERSRFLKLLARSLLKMADIITLPANHMLNFVYESCRAKAKIIPMGVNTSMFSGSQKRDDIIISTRSFYPIYNIETLLKAFSEINKRFPQYKLVLAGDGPLKNNLETLSKSLNISGNTYFAGALEHDELAKRLSCAKIFVSTSLSDGAPVSLMEALSAELLPVVSDIPANREWISDGVNGFLFEPGNPIELAKKLEAAIIGYDSYKNTLSKNRKLIENNADWEIIVERFLAIYRSIIYKKGGENE